ncbi:MAG: lytic transglycosylase domain-containing protein [Pseudomonadota bacterium]
MITRGMLLVALAFATALPALAERPRPMGWAVEAMRGGEWEAAATVAAKDGPIASDVIEWSRLRDGQGTYSDIRDFLDRRPDWPGERYLRKQSERAVVAAGDSAVREFFEEVPPQTPKGVLAYAALLRADGSAEKADEILRSAWIKMPMDPRIQAAFLAENRKLLAPLHDARLDEMLWEGYEQNARQMYELSSDAAVAEARARLALRARAKGVDTLIEKVPASHLNTGGLNYERFVWRARKGRMEEAKALLKSVSVSAEALGRPEAWANRRRALARQEMRSGDAELAYEMASRHFLTEGANYADLEWLSGYIALRKLDEPETALRHFENHDAAVRSPISKGRAGYWRGRAQEATGDIAAADQAYTQAAQYQTSFYGLLAAERATLPFDLEILDEEAIGNWQQSDLSSSSVFQAGLLLQASGELSLAERFWTHLAESLDRNEAGLLAQAAIDSGQPHLAVMIGKRTARRTVVIPRGYYPLHPVARAELPMAPEMLLSIARRESEFDPNVQSPVGARGLMQIMPATGRDVAASLGRLPEHTTDRLISDPVYNAELGAAYLAGLARRFRGNVVMMSAGYNAGPGRPDRWMQIFGDPRQDAIDIVDWIEHIPFRETRNYVMRVTESLPTYRFMLGKPAMPQPFSKELTGSTLLAFAPKGE